MTQKRKKVAWQAFDTFLDHEEDRALWTSSGDDPSWDAREDKEKKEKPAADDQPDPYNLMAAYYDLYGDK